MMLIITQSFTEKTQSYIENTIYHAKNAKLKIQRAQRKCRQELNELTLIEFHSKNAKGNADKNYTN